MTIDYQCMMGARGTLCDCKLCTFRESQPIDPQVPMNFRDWKAAKLLDLEERLAALERVVNGVQPNNGDIA